MADAAYFVDRMRPRSRQKVAGASDIGPCLRKAAFLRHRVEPTDEPGQNMSAILGTWIHAGALDALERVHGIFQEIPMEHPSKLLRGHADTLWLGEEHDPDGTAPGGVFEETTLEDTKTKADDRMLDTIRSYGPPPDEIRQVYTYVWLMSQFGTKVGRTGNRRKLRWLKKLGPIRIDRVRLRYIARDRGEEYVWEERVDPARVKEARERFELVRDSTEPSELPREQRGPGLSYVCDSCPFRTACWGAGAVDENGVWPQSILVVEGETTNEEQVTKYRQGMALEKDGKTLKETAKAILTGKVPPATVGKVQFGDAGVVGWTGGNDRGMVEDVEKMRRIIVEAGVPVPMKDGGKTNRSFSVGPPRK